jgi:hypothetical protein
MRDHDGMTAELIDVDVCGVCHAPIPREKVCHLYEKGAAIPFCGAGCAERHLQSRAFGDEHGDGGRSVLEMMLAQIRWQACGE